jgi:flagellar FliJ protein
MYEFKLEPLLNYRKLIEESLQKELAILQLKLADENKNLNDLRVKEERMQFELKQRQKNPMSSDELIMYINFFHRIAQEIEIQKKSVFKAQEHTRQKREELLEAVKKRETFNKLKQKGIDQYQKKILREEQIDLNEIAVNKFNREKSKG